MLVENSDCELNLFILSSNNEVISILLIHGLDLPITGLNIPPRQVVVSGNFQLLPENRLIVAFGNEADFFISLKHAFQSVQAQAFVKETIYDPQLAFLLHKFMRFFIEIIFAHRLVDCLF